MKKYNYIFEIIILNLKNFFWFIIFIDYYLIININKIKLSKFLSLAKLIKKFPNKQK